MQDVCCLAYHSYMLSRVAMAADTQPARDGMPALLLLFFSTALTIVAVRGELLPPGRLRALTYRLGIVVPVCLAYVPLRHALPALGNPLLDAQLFQVDAALFGDTPARQLERFVNPRSVEWFAFFYYSYFTIVFLHVVGSALFDRGRRAAEVLFGAMAVCCIGHTLYTLVPGVGPYAAVPFRQPLVGGYFYGLVWDAVASAGALLDIFPSLHTAYPSLFTLHALRHRRTLPYRYTALPTAFFTINIIIATLFLRWHYAIDVVAGLLVAALSQQLAIRFAKHESDERRATRQPVWEILTYRTAEREAGTDR